MPIPVIAAKHITHKDKRTGSVFIAQNRKPLDFPKLPDVNEDVCHEVIANVNKKLVENTAGRLFAIVHLCGKQFKVTDGDILIIEGYWAPSIGDQLRLEKVMPIAHSLYVVQKYDLEYIFRHCNRFS